jgi:hypothetical protein
MFEIRRIPRTAAAAYKLADRAVKLRDLPRSRRDVQAVDILRDRERQNALPLPLGQDAMCGIGFRPRPVGQGCVEDGADRLPRSLRIGVEAAYFEQARVDLVPEPARAAECPDAAFDRNSRAREGDEMFTAFDYRGCTFNIRFERLMHRNEYTAGAACGERPRRGAVSKMHHLFYFAKRLSQSQSNLIKNSLFGSVS